MQRNYITHWIFGLVLICTGEIQAGTIFIDWQEINASSATGTIGDIRVRAETAANAPFVQGLANGFAAPNWDAEFELAPEAVALVTSHVNAGEVQSFQFEPAIVDAFFYIENLDSHTEALVTADDGIIELVSSSPSIEVTQRDDLSTVVISSSNQSFDGEGDLILRLVGEVTVVRMAYYRGIGDNGVLYGFAIQNVPESFKLQNLAFFMLPVVRLMSRRHRRRPDTTQ